MNRRSFLGGVLAGLMWPRVGRAATDRVLVVYLAKGGWDPTYVFDPHFGENVGGDGASQPASAGPLSWAAASSRPAVSRFLQQHSSRCAIVNGLAVGSISHDMCTRIVLTGTRDPSASDMATTVGALTGAGLAAPTLVVSGPRFPGRLGGAQVPLTRTLSDIVAEPLDDEVQAFLRAEAQRAELLDSDEALARLEALVQAGDGLRVGEQASWEDRLDVGLDALAGSLSRCAVVQGTTPVLGQWDSHSSNHTNQDPCFEHCFQQLERISQGLDERGLRDRAVVLALSEMGRTPALNGTQGKDHWPYTSLMAWGSGVVPGVHGATNSSLVGQDVEGGALTPARLAAGLLEHFDADPAEVYGGVSPWRSLWS